MFTIGVCKNNMKRKFATVTNKCISQNINTSIDWSKTSLLTSDFGLIPPLPKDTTGFQGLTGYNPPKKSSTRLHLFEEMYTDAESSTINNINLPSCKDCKFHRPGSIRDYASSLSKCAKFGEKNVLTGEIIYDYTSVARGSEIKCGMNGRHFQLEPNIRFKTAKYILYNNVWYLFPLSLFIVKIVSILVRK
jgi:hypothetical protein